MNNFFKAVFDSFLHYVVSTILTLLAFVVDYFLVYLFLWTIWDNNWLQLTFISPFDMKLLCLVGVLVLEIGRILYHILDMKDEIMEYKKMRYL